MILAGAGKNHSRNWERLTNMTQEELKNLIDSMPTELPERESDEFDAGLKYAKEYLILKLNDFKANQ